MLTWVGGALSPYTRASSSVTVMMYWCFRRLDIYSSLHSRPILSASTRSRLARWSRDVFMPCDIYDYMYCRRYTDWRLCWVIVKQSLPCSGTGWRRAHGNQSVYIGPCSCQLSFSLLLERIYSAQGFMHSSRIRCGNLFWPFVHCILEYRITKVKQKTKHVWVR